MGWTDPALWVPAVGQLITPEILRTYVRDNLIDVGRRVSFKNAEIQVAPQQTTTSTTYADLATVGPQVSVEIGQTGEALVHLYCALSNNNAGNASHMSFAVTGATTRQASDLDSIAFTAPVNFGGARFGGTFWVHSLVPGVHTFTAKYRVSGGTGQFDTRRIMVVPFGS